MLIDDLRAFARDPNGYPDGAAAVLCNDAADILEKLYRRHAQCALTDEQLDRAAFQLFCLDNNASRWPSVNQGHYRKEAKSILDAALTLPARSEEQP